MTHPMRKLFRAVLWMNDDPLSVHTFYLEPEGKHSGYAAMTSLQWFQDRELEARYGAKPKKNLSPFHMGLYEYQRDYERQLASYKKHCEDQGREFVDDTATLPQRHHESLWDFYEAIGYDYKTKTWTREVPASVSQ